MLVDLAQIRLHLSKISELLRTSTKLDVGAECLYEALPDQNIYFSKDILENRWVLGGELISPRASCPCMDVAASPKKSSSLRVDAMH
jgi:hypothetical protein